jgi:hypothetical protein
VTKCQTKFCRNKPAPKKNFCHKCNSRRYRAANPISALFCNAKSHAKSRGHAWLLTREEFEQFCHETGYHLTVGRSAESSSIDRIDGSLPYQAGNIQLKSVSANSIKSWFDGSRAPVAVGSPDEPADF